MTAAVRDHVRPVRWKVRRYLAAAAPLVALTLAAPLAIVLWDDFDIFFTVLSTAPLMAWSSWFAVRDLRAALPVYDRAVAVLMACREVRPAVPPVEVRLLPGPDEHRRLLWDGREVAWWHDDGTATLLDDSGRPHPQRLEPPAVDRVDLGSPLVDEVTLGTATFVRWLGRGWVDDLGRLWTPPASGQVLADEPRFLWPADSGALGLLAYLELITKRRAEALAAERAAQHRRGRRRGTPDRPPSDCAPAPAASPSPAAGRRRATTATSSSPSDRPRRAS